jgi:hypothetical protein
VRIDDVRRTSKDGPGSRRCFTAGCGFSNANASAWLAWGRRVGGFGAGLALGAILSAPRYGYYYGPYYGYYGPSYYPYAAYYGPVCDIHRRVVFHHGHRHVYRYRVCY